MTERRKAQRSPNFPKYLTLGERLTLASKEEGECLVWQRAKDHDGYGLLGFNGIRKAHRVAYELSHGPIKPGLVVMHSCDNPSCIRPSHLSVGTVADNRADSVAKGRSFKGERINGKLTAALVLEIRRDPMNGHRAAEKYGVSFQTISRVRRREIWKHV